jgi:hypothetical protein
VEWWTDFWTYFDALPEGPQGYLLGTAVALFGVLLGSIFALFGVYSTNRTNQKNLRMQLAHDQAMRAEEHAHDQAMRAKEHELNLRKQIYLDTAEAIALGMASITEIQNLNKSALEVRDAFAKRASGTARLHVVASEEVALKFAKLYRQLDDTFMTLRVDRIALDDMRAETLRHASMRDHYQKSTAKLADLVREGHLAGSMTNERFAALNALFERESKLATEHDASHTKLAQTLRPLHLEFTKRCYAEHARLSKLTIPLIAAVRRDMGIPINEDTYLEVVTPNEDNLKQLRKLFGLPAEQPTQT